MAIKGKSKGRSRGRGVTPGPKPTYVEVKRPLLRRRWFQVTAGLLILLLATGGIAYGVLRERNQQREAEEARTARAAVGQYRSEMDQALAGIGQPVQAGFAILPEVIQAIPTLQAGEGNPRRVGEEAREGVEAATAAIEAIEAIDAVGIVTGLPRDLVQTILDAHESILSGVKLHRQVAVTVAEATDVSGEERERLLSLAADLEPIAGEVFQNGYLSYVSAQAETGILDPLAGLPTG